MIRKKLKASVTFELDVVDSLDTLSKQLDRDRSWIINNLARLYRRRVEEGREQTELFDLSAAITSAVVASPAAPASR